MPAPDDFFAGDVDDLAQINVASEFGVWADYRVSSRYVNCPQVYMMPVTSPAGFQGTSVAFVQLAAPTTALVVDWTAAQWSAVPTLPNPDLYDSNWVILYKLPQTAMKILAADGVTPLYRVNGTYVYGQKSPAANVYDNVSFPQPPWMEDYSLRTIDPNKLKQGIVDSTYTLRTPGAGGNGRGLGPGGPVS